MGFFNRSKPNLTELTLLGFATMTIGFGLFPFVYGTGSPVPDIAAGKTSPIHGAYVTDVYIWPWLNHLFGGIIALGACLIFVDVLIWLMGRRIEGDGLLWFKPLSTFEPTGKETRAQKIEHWICGLVLALGLSGLISSLWKEQERLDFQIVCFLFVFGGILYFTVARRVSWNFWLVAAFGAAWAAYYLSSKQTGPSWDLDSHRSSLLILAAIVLIALANRRYLKISRPD